MAFKILAFAGSTRTGSYNKKLIRLGVKVLEKSTDISVTLIDLRDYPLPLYDGDLEAKEGIPENAKKLKTLFKEHQGFLLSCPEYNSSISGVLKNTLDWVSRPMQGEKELEPYKGKVVGLLSASPGQYGGMRGLVIVRSMLGNIGSLVCPDQFSLSKAHEAFNEQDQLKDEKSQKFLENVCGAFLQTVKKIAN